MKKVFFILSLSLLFVSINSSASTTPADEPQRGNTETTTSLSEKNNKCDDSTAKDVAKEDKVQPKDTIKWSAIKSAAKPFGYGILFGIIGTILCVCFRPDKYIWRKIMKKLSKFVENHKSNECEVNDSIKPAEPTESTVVDTSQTSHPNPVTNPDPKPEPDPEPLPEPPTITLNPTTFAVDKDNWSVVGTSVIGNSHISMKLPCQDNCKYEYIGDGWGIAVTSDGAGSAKRSEIGSKIVVERAVLHFKQLIEEQGWRKNNELPTDAIWTKYAYTILHKIYQEIVAFSKTKELACKDLSATAIVIIHTPKGLLCSHIGDGRAGFRSATGEWKTVITPHKGEEANQTIFITSDFWTIPNYTMSDVFVPESIVVREEISAFTLMSDGCEYTAWECNHLDEEKNKYYDPNKPYAKFYESLSQTLIKYHNEEVDINRRKEQWQQFLTDGNKSLQKEPDDKTLILGVLCE